ncbi:MAG: hypothetical protein IJA59_09115, partial [Clostridia bacterium]|nr:hypothetical protein [Clostridia bacterium]
PVRLRRHEDELDVYVTFLRHGMEKTTQYIKNPFGSDGRCDKTGDKSPQMSGKAKINHIKE